jgi:hypothetical protein
MGYSFDWQKRVLVQTGGLYLKSLPSGAQILINNKDKKTTPRLLSRLRPQTYDIAVTKDNFYSWQKKLEVAPQLVTEARNIILFPKQTNPQLIQQNVTSTIEYFLSSPEEYQKETQAQKIASSSVGWLLKNDNVFYIAQTNQILYRADLSGFVREQISKEYLPENKYKIIASGNNHFAALSGGGDLYLLNKDSGVFEKISSQIKDANFSNDNKKLLYRNENEIWIIYLENILIQPYKKIGEKELITRFAQKISDAIFYPDNEHIAFVVGDQIKIIELDSRDQRNAIDFLVAKNPQIYLDEPSSYFYYLTEKNLWRLKPEL